jgi:Zn-dependent alcohol dehydrogenase
MRAAVLQRSGERIAVLDDLDLPAPRAGEVRVRVKFCGLCHSDLTVMEGAFPLTQPVVPGHEAAGVVDAVGAGVTQLQPGDHVVLTPVPSCGNCYYCQRRDFSLCVNSIGVMSNRLLDGSTHLSRGGVEILRGCGVGALAECIVVPASGAVKIPAEMPLDLAALLGCAVQTGVGAVLNTARVEPGATVLVTGLGGIGMSAVQGARIAGATTLVAADLNTERLAIAARFGATHCVNPANEDLAARCAALTGGIGMDYAFECAGRTELVELGVQCTRAGGTTVSVGSPGFEQTLGLPHFVLFAATGKKLCGCLLGSSHSQFEIPRLARFWQRGLLDLESLVTARRPLAEVNAGFDDLRRGIGIRTVIAL